LRGTKVPLTVTPPIKIGSGLMGRAKNKKDDKKS